MQEVVYVDVLFFINTVITFLLLLTVRQLSGVSASGGRLAVASAAGGVYSLILLAPPLPWPLLLLTRGFMCVSLSFLAFHIRRWRTMARCTLLFLGVSFLFAGALYSFSFLFDGGFLTVQNGCAYAALSPPTLIGLCTAFYFLLRFLKKKVFRPAASDFICRATLCYGEREIGFSALFDSGNEVQDVYAGRPVIIVSPFVWEALTGAPPPADPALAPGSPPLRLLPVHTLGKTGLLPAFTAGRLLLQLEGEAREVLSPCVALAPDALGEERYQGLIGAAVMENGRISA